MSLGNLLKFLGIEKPNGKDLTWVVLPLEIIYGSGKKGEGD